MEEIEIKQMEAEVKKVCAQNGHPVLMGTDFCKSWKRHHKNCFGCSSKLGCDKLATFLLCCAKGIQIPSDFFNHWDGYEDDKRYWNF